VALTLSASPPVHLPLDEVSAIAAKIVAEVLDPPPPSVIRRLSRPDLDHIGPWLIGRLMKSYPDRNYGALYQFLVQALSSNDALVIRNDAAVAMAVIQSRMLSKGIIKEVFCFAIDYDGAGDEEDHGPANEAAVNAATLYPAIVEWGKRMGAAEAWLLENSDADKVRAQKQIGPIDTGRYLWVGLT
jgi:hypothetical protein